MSDIEIYSPARYFAVLSVVDYQGSATVDDVDFYAHSEESLKPEAESLENLGILNKNGDDEYEPCSPHREMISQIGDMVQIDYNGIWKDIDEDDIDQILEEKNEKIHWLI